MSEINMLKPKIGALLEVGKTNMRGTVRYIRKISNYFVVGVEYAGSVRRMSFWDKDVEWSK